MSVCAQGHLNEDGFQFCSICGLALTAPQESHTPLSAAPSQISAQPDTAVGQKQRSKLLTAAVAAIAVILLLIAGMVGYNIIQANNARAAEEAAQAAARAAEEAQRAEAAAAAQRACTKVSSLSLTKDDLTTQASVYDEIGADVNAAVTKDPETWQPLGKAYDDFGTFLLMFTAAAKQFEEALTNWSYNTDELTNATDAVQAASSFGAKTDSALDKACVPTASQ